MAIRKSNTSRHVRSDEVEGVACSFCGQLLREAHDRHLTAQLRKRAEEEIRAEYAKKEAVTVAALTAKAEDKVRKTYELRVRQMEQSNRGLQVQLDVYKRRIEQISPTARGAFNEEELVVALRREFPEDRIDRVKRGPAGRGDILHEVRCSDNPALASAGRIVLECKDTARWDNDYLIQAKAAKEYHRAGHVVLVSATFPAKQLAFAVIDGVVIVDSGRMLSVVRILRTSMQQLARAGLSTEARRAKGDALLRYLAGQDFRAAFSVVDEAVEDVESLLLKERRHHDLTWARREGYYRRMGAGLSEIHEAISGIVERPEDEQAQGREAGQYAALSVG